MMYHICFQLYQHLTSRITSTIHHRIASYHIHHILSLHITSCNNKSTIIVRTVPFRFRLFASSISIENSRFNCLTCSVPTLSSLLEKTLSTPSLPPLTKSSDPDRGYTVQTQLGCMMDCTASEPAHTITPPSSPHVTIVTPTNESDDDDDGDDDGDDDEGELSYH